MGNMFAAQAWTPNFGSPEPCKSGMSLIQCWWAGARWILEDCWPASLAKMLHSKLLEKLVLIYIKEDTCSIVLSVAMAKGSREERVLF